MSKIKKITAIKKNRKENGMRAVLKGVNPHSNGEHFSRSLLVFILMIMAIVIIIEDSVIITIIDVVIISIVFL